MWFQLRVVPPACYGAWVLRYLACWWEGGGSGMSSFNPRNHGTLAFRRKERPCLSSSFLDVDPSRAPLVRVESSGTLSNRVSWEVRSGRFALDANLNKPPPRATQRVWTSEHCPRASPEHVNSLSQDHPRFPYHARTGRFTDAGRPGDTILPGPKHFIAERTSGTAELGETATRHACSSRPDLRSSAADCRVLCVCACVSQPSLFRSRVPFNVAHPLG